MKKLSIYLTMSVMAVLAVACSKNGSQVDPTKPEAAKEANIGFGSASAKAPDALVVNTEKPMQIQVFDFYTKQSRRRPPPVPGPLSARTNMPGRKARTSSSAG